MNYFFSYKKILTLIFLFFCLPHSIEAGEIRIEVSENQVSKGDEFLATILLYSKEEINAIEGQLIFDEQILEVSEIRDANSYVNLWILKPFEENGGINFSGITPGGFKGVNNLVFSVVFRAKQTGDATLSFSNIKTLKNDGIGSEEKTLVANASIIVKEGDSNVQKEFVYDDENPEQFTPVVFKDESIFENKWVVSFFTQDKKSGISHYEIKEYKFNILAYFVPWKIVQSPHVLSDQELKSTILIKATDNSENYIISKINPQNKLSLPDFTIWIVLSIFILFLLLRMLSYYKK